MASFQCHLLNVGLLVMKEPGIPLPLDDYPQIRIPSNVTPCVNERSVYLPSLTKTIDGDSLVNSMLQPESSLLKDDMFEVVIFSTETKTQSVPQLYHRLCFSHNCHDVHPTLQCCTPRPDATFIRTCNLPELMTENGVDVDISRRFVSSILSIDITTKDKLYENLLKHLPGSSNNHASYRAMYQSASDLLRLSNLQIAFANGAHRAISSQIALELLLLNDDGLTSIHIPNMIKSFPGKLYEFQPTATFFEMILRISDDHLVKNITYFRHYLFHKYLVLDHTTINQKIQFPSETTFASYLGNGSKIILDKLGGSKYWRQHLEKFTDRLENFPHQLQSFQYNLRTCCPRHLDGRIYRNPVGSENMICQIQLLTFLYLCERIIRQRYPNHTLQLLYSKLGLSLSCEAAIFTELIPVFGYLSSISDLLTGYIKPTCTNQPLKTQPWTKKFLDYVRIIHIWYDLITFSCTLDRAYLDGITNMRSAAAGRFPNTNNNFDNVTTCSDIAFYLGVVAEFLSKFPHIYSPTYTRSQYFKSMDVGPNIFLLLKERLLTYYLPLISHDPSSPADQSITSQLSATREDQVREEDGEEDTTPSLRRSSRLKTTNEASAVLHSNRHLSAAVSTNVSTSRKRMKTKGSHRTGDENDNLVDDYKQPLHLYDPPEEINHLLIHPSKITDKAPFKRWKKQNRYILYSSESIPKAYSSSLTDVMNGTSLVHISSPLSCAINSADINKEITKSSINISCIETGYGKLATDHEENMERSSRHFLREELISKGDRRYKKVVKGIGEVRDKVSAYLETNCDIAYTVTSNSSVLFDSGAKPHIQAPHRDYVKTDVDNRRIPTSHYPLSCIYGVDKFSLVIFHKDKGSLGSNLGTRLFIPRDCAIFFSSELYHSGDRFVFEEDNPSNCRIHLYCLPSDLTQPTVADEPYESVVPINGVDREGRKDIIPHVVSVISSFEVDDPTSNYNNIINLHKAFGEDFSEESRIGKVYGMLVLIYNYLSLSYGSTSADHDEQIIRMQLLYDGYLQEMIYILKRENVDKEKSICVKRATGDWVINTSD
jgi:hypothetical protein